MKNYPFYTTIFFIFSFFLFVFLVFPKYQTLNVFKKEVLEKQEEFRSQEKYFETLQDASEELKKYEGPLSKVDSALPKNPSLPELLNFIQKASSQSGLSLKGISPAVTLPFEKGEIKETRINFLLVGSYSDFKNFLSILEKSARLIDVENISFALAKEKEGLFNFNITIKVYSY